MFFLGQIAQSVEQRTENPRVGGSIPSLTTFKPFDFFEGLFVLSQCVVFMFKKPYLYQKCHIYVTQNIK